MELRNICSTIKQEYKKSTTTTTTSFIARLKVKLELQHNILIQIKVTFTQNNYTANRAE